MGMAVIGLFVIGIIVVVVFLLISVLGSSSKDSKKDTTMIKPKYKNKK